VSPPARDLRTLARRLELAEAEQLARTGGAGLAGVLAAAGGQAVFKSPRSPFSAALGTGLEGPVAAGDVDLIEAHLGRGGGEVRIELCAPADPSLAAELGRRGYRVERFQQVWWRPVAGGAPLQPPPAGIEVRVAAPGEEQAWLHVIARAFLGSPVTDEVAPGLRAMARAEGNVCFAALHRGEIAGVAIASAWGGVASLTGAGVAPEHRGRRLQLALVAARLRWAAEQGCDLAGSVTEPGTASQRTLEEAGFRCAYPKAVMVRGG
jgi:GNAT superfamily N-acetyltransferase